jgi:hypothetical protein
MREFWDTPNRRMHDAFNQWRKSHPTGCYLTFGSSLNLHAVSCHHVGGVLWDGRTKRVRKEVVHSVTRNRKVCADDEMELILWAQQNEMDPKPCRTCYRYLDESAGQFENKHAGRTFFIAIPSAAQYVNALQRIGPKITTIQQALLLAHYSAPARTATARYLASSIGLSKWQVVNSQYGRLGSLLRRTLNFRSGGQASFILASFCRRASDAEWEWIMHPQVAMALERLGWVQSAKSISEDAKPSLSAPLSRGQGFGDAIHNAAVEKAACSFVWAAFERTGWSVSSVERDQVGYDLHCQRGSAERHVEVKGISGTKLAAIVTANELAISGLDADFRIAFVVDALGAPKAHYFTGAELRSQFEARPIQFSVVARGPHVSGSAEPF